MDFSTTSTNRLLLLKCHFPPKTPILLQSLFQRGPWSTYEFFSPTEQLEPLNFPSQLENKLVMLLLLLLPTLLAAKEQVVDSL